LHNNIAEFIDRAANPAPKPWTVRGVFYLAPTENTECLACFSWESRPSLPKAFRRGPTGRSKQARMGGSPSAVRRRGNHGKT